MPRTPSKIWVNGEKSVENIAAMYAYFFGEIYPGMYVGM
jgi:hypothetical protein